MKSGLSPFPGAALPANNITGSGTLDFLAQFTGPNVIGDSLIKKVGSLYEFLSNSGIRINGRIDLGGAGNSEVVLTIKDNPLAAGGDQKAVDADFLFRNAGVINSAIVYRARGNLQDAAYTIPSLSGFYVEDPFKPAAATITTLYGLRIGDQTKGGTNYAIHTGLGLVRHGDQVQAPDYQSLTGPKKLINHLLKKYVSGFKCSTNSTNPNFQIDIEEGACSNSTADTLIENSGTITVDITASGVNGLDTGSEAANTWYYIHIIYNPATDTTAGLLSTSASSPTLPAGYTKFRRVGAVRNDSTSNFLAYRTEGNESYKQIIYPARHTLLENGTDTAWTDIDCSGFVPPTSRQAQVIVNVFNTGADCATRWREDGITATLPRSLWAFGEGTLESMIPLSTSQIFEYLVPAGDEAAYYILGYWEEI